MLNIKKLLTKILQKLQSIDAEFVIMNVSFSTTTNSSVSPFGAFCEVRMESQAPTGYTAIAITPDGVGSANPVLCRIFNDSGSFFAYSKSAVTMTARIIYKRNV